MRDAEFQGVIDWEKARHNSLAWKATDAVARYCHACNVREEPHRSLSPDVTNLTRRSIH